MCYDGTLFVLWYNLLAFLKLHPGHQPKVTYTRLNTEINTECWKMNYDHV